MAGTITRVSSCARDLARTGLKAAGTALSWSTCLAPIAQGLERTNFHGRTVSLRGGVGAAAGAVTAGIEAGRLLRGRTDSSSRAGLAATIAAGAGGCAGLVDDLDAGAHDGDSPAKGLKGHLTALAHGRVTTGALKIAVIGSGALIGGASEHEADILYRFGIYIGLAFQLQDDLLDVYGSPETFGKNIGGDILCNKKTFLLIHTLASASPEQKEQIVYYQHPDKAACYTADEKIKAITSIYDQLNIRELTQEQMKHYYNLAMDELALLKIPQGRLSELHRVCRKLMNREK